MLIQKNHMLYESSTGDGFIFCDGISIDNVSAFYIDIPDDEICLLDNYGNTIGEIRCLEERTFCSFSEFNKNKFKDYDIIIRGKIQKNIAGD